MKIIGNIFGGILALVGFWRLFAAIDGTAVMDNGLRMFDYTGAAQNMVDSLYIQSVILLILGIGILIVSNLPKSKPESSESENKVPEVLPKEKWEGVPGMEHIFKGTGRRMW